MFYFKETCYLVFWVKFVKPQSKVIPLWPLGRYGLFLERGISIKKFKTFRTIISFYFLRFSCQYTSQSALI